MASAPSPGGVNGSQMWTYGEDDPTEIWTLRGNTDDQPAAAGEADAAPAR